MPVVLVLSPVVVCAVGYGALQLMGSGGDQAASVAPEPMVRRADVGKLISAPAVVLEEVDDSRAPLEPVTLEAEVEAPTSAAGDDEPGPETVCIRIPGLDGLNRAGGATDPAAWTLRGAESVAIKTGVAEGDEVTVDRDALELAETLKLEFGAEPRSSVVVRLDRLDLTGPEAESDILGVERAESAAIATLRSIAAAQQQLQASAGIDTDGDGGGEFGYFAEMAGAVPPRGSDKAMNPTFLPKAFGVLVPGSGGGVVSRQGYVFQMILPGGAGARPVAGAPEAQSGGSGPLSPDPSNAEIMWCCYAWPLYEVPGEPRRTFFINQDGDVLATTRDAGMRYVGLQGGPPIDAAYTSPLDMGSQAALALAGLRGNDGNRWIPAGS